jgi:hypothetical protein
LIESSLSKPIPEPQIIQVPHECNFNENSLRDIQTKLVSLTNTVNSLKEESKKQATPEKNPKPSLEDNINPDKANNPPAVINGFNNFGGYQPPKKEPFGGQPFQLPIGGGGAKPG